MSNLSICEKCKSGQKNIVGRKCQACIDYNMFEKAKEYVLVSQGIEIYRTTDKEEAEKMMNESNKSWREYVERCIEEGERPADNEVFMYEEGE